MRSRAVAFLCIVGTLGLSAAEASLRGPWQVVEPDGAHRLMVAVSPASAATLSGLQAPTVDDRAVPLQVWRAYQDGEAIVGVRIPPGRSGSVAWEVAGATVTATVQPLPAGTDRVRVLVCGRRWPATADIERAERAGGALGLVVVLAPPAAQRIGSGGWEARLPFAVVPTYPIAAALDVATAGQAAGWSRRIVWGPLGLPVTGSDPGADLANDLSSWQVAIEPRGHWDPGLLADPGRDHDGAGFDALISAAVRLRTAWIVSAGSSGGGVSQLLAPGVDGRAARSPDGDGVRIVALSAEFERALAGWDDALALPADHHPFLLLTAEPAKLSALLVADDDVLPSIPLPDTPRTTAAPLAELVAALESAAAPAAEGAAAGAAAGRADRAAVVLLWGPLDGILADEALRERLLASTHPLVAVLRRRLVAADPLAYRGVDPVLSRDRLLRLIASAPGDAALWAGGAAASEDAQVVRAVIRNVRFDRAQSLMQVLVRRIALQAQGRIALDPDPLVQHALTSAVFGSPFLSPTGLRGYAVALRDRVAPLARAPIERFLERHGAVRPVQP